MVAVTLYLAVAATVLCYTYYKFLYRKLRPGEPPIAPGNFLWGNGKQFADHAVNFLLGVRNKLGSVFTIRLLNQHWTMILDIHSYERFSREKNFDFFLVQEQVNRNVFNYALVDARKILGEAGQRVNGKHLFSTMDNFARNLADTMGGKKFLPKVNNEDLLTTNVTSDKTTINTDSNNNENCLSTQMKNLKNEDLTTQGQFYDSNYDLNKLSSNDHASFLEKPIPSMPSNTTNPNEWKQDYLRNFASEYFFSAVFYTIFGRGEPGKEGNFHPQIYYKNFDKFHKYFNYLWLGLPHFLFPSAGKAVEILAQQPCSKDMVKRDGCSEYIKYAIEFMLNRNQSESDIVGHNLVFLHVNYNTFRAIYWCMYTMMEQPEALAGIRKEVEEVIDSKRMGKGFDGEEEMEFTTQDINKMPVLDSFIQEIIRYYSGVFMVRYCIEDTKFTLDNGDSYNIRKGDKVAMYPPVFHYDPEVFDKPTEFQYDRFVNTSFFKDGKKIKHPVIGFGSLCPGQKLSFLQIKWYIINLVNMFNFELLEGESTTANTDMYGHEILPPKSDVMCRMQKKEHFSTLKFLNNYGKKSS